MGSNPAKSIGFLGTIKAIAGLRSEVKKGHWPHVVRFHSMLKIP
jgi:hypothetical protein